MPTTIETTAYKFSELSQTAKDRACGEHAETLWGNWWGDVYDDFRERCESAGFREPDFRFSGFHSQGDGASFSCRFRFEEAQALEMLNQEDRDEVTRALAEARLHGFKTEFGIYGNIRADGRYCHSNTMRVNEYCLGFDATGSDGADTILSFAAERLSSDTEKNILEAARSIADDLYEALEEEYEYLTSEDCLAEHSETNDYLYDEHGSLI